MKRVLFILDNLGPGGAQRQVVTVARLLKKSGKDVTVMCYGVQDFFAPILKEANIPVVWNTEEKALNRIFKVRRFVRHGGFDVVISFLHTENILNILSSLGGHRWKVICGERSAKEGAFSSMKGRFHGLLMYFSNSIVCNSENARNMWLRHYPNYQAKLKVIYNSVTLNSLNSSYAPLKNGKLNIVIAASYQYLKNPIGLVEGINLLPIEVKNHLKVDWYGRKEVVAGDFRAYNETCALIKKYNLGQVISLNEETNDIHNKMIEADIVALFSWVEGLPNCICEGMTLGKPIIMTKVSDYNILVDKSNGFLCDWNAPETIAKAIEGLVRMEISELRSLGENSKKKAENLFSSEVVLEKWTSVIDD